MIKKINDKQKWAIIILVGCIITLLTALTETPWHDIIDVIQGRRNSSMVVINWSGCFLVGVIFSSITGLFLFKDK